MPDYFYSVMVDGAEVGRIETLSDAMIFTEALLSRYYQDTSIVVAIKREEKTNG